MPNYSKCICLTFLHCAFSNVDSKSLDQSRQSHTGCICSTFLNGVFLSEPSKSLPERMQSHIGCICVWLLQCVFSNELSNGLIDRIHSHIGCICVTFSIMYFQMSPQMACKRRCIITLIALVWLFSQCVFSCVSSNCLLERMESHTGCICLTFLHGGFSNVSSYGLCVVLCPKNCFKLAQSDNQFFTQKAGGSKKFRCRLSYI